MSEFAVLATASVAMLMAAWVTFHRSEYQFAEYI
jgi:hypothetical protein